MIMALIVWLVGVAWNLFPLSFIYCFPQPDIKSDGIASRPHRKFAHDRMQKSHQSFRQFHRRL